MTHLIGIGVSYVSIHVLLLAACTVFRVNSGEQPASVPSIVSLARPSLKERGSGQTAIVELYR